MNGLQARTLTDGQPAPNGRLGRRTFLVGQNFLGKIPECKLQLFLSCLCAGEMLRIHGQPGLLCEDRQELPRVSILEGISGAQCLKEASMLSPARRRWDLSWLSFS